MSPRTAPCRTRSVTSTRPSMEPVSLTDKEVGISPASPRTPPPTWPSRCRPPANSTSPLILTDLAISVSIRAGFESRLNTGFSTLRRQNRAPRKCLGQRRDVLASRIDLDRQMLRAKARWQRYGLVELLVVAKVIGYFGLAASRQSPAVEGCRLTARSLAVYGQADAAGRHAVGLAGADERDMYEEMSGRLTGGQTNRAHAHPNRWSAFGNDGTVERQLLRLPGDLRLQVTDGPRNDLVFPGVTRVQSLELDDAGLQTGIRAFELRDLIVQLRALLDGGKNVVAGVVPAELEGDANPDEHEDGETNREDHPPYGRMRPYLQAWMIFHALREESNDRRTEAFALMWLPTSPGRRRLRLRAPRDLVPPVRQGRRAFGKGNRRELPQRP